MKVTEVNQINLTVVFTEPINHGLINNEAIINLYKVKDNKPKRHALVEAPNLKVFEFTDQQKQVIFEAQRILINEKGEGLPKSSEIANYANEIVNKIIQSKNIAAYGFNYYLVIEPEKGKVDPKKFLSTKIRNVITNIQGAGIQVIFTKDERKLDLRLNPIDDKRMLAHFNIEKKKQLPDRNKVKEELINNYKEIEKILRSI